MAVYSYSKIDLNISECQGILMQINYLSDSYLIQRVQNQFRMQNRSDIINSLQQKYQEYIQKIKLTDQAKTRTYQIKAELAIIALIYSTTSTDNKKPIEKKLFEVQKVLDARLRGQGWLSFLSKTNEVVTLDQVWGSISLFKNDFRANLIRDVCQLKKITS